MERELEDLIANITDEVDACKSAFDVSQVSTRITNLLIMTETRIRIIQDRLKTKITRQDTLLLRPLMEKRDELNNLKTYIVVFLCTRERV